MMGYGMRHGVGPSMMDRGKGQGMGSGMMGRGMGQGTSPGILGPGARWRDRDLSVEDVKGMAQHRLEHYGNDRLRVGKVEEKDDDVVIAEIETLDGSLVERYEVDRHTGWMQRSN